MKLASRADVLRAVGVGVAAVGLAHREAFFSVAGAILLTGGALLIALTLGMRQAADPAPASGVFGVLFLLLSLVAALAPYDPSGINGVELVLTISAPLVFFSLGAVPGATRYRLYAVAAALIAAHAHYLLRFPHPLHQDVWTFLNGGADLLAHGANPYGGVHFLEDGVGKIVPFTYPPGALVILAPFRFLTGDIRWAYVVSEAVVVALWGWWLSSRGELTRAREALILVPLVLPRTSQAFFIFSNHEWVLLALALTALVLADRGHDLAAGVALGVGVVSKQYFIVFPLLFLLPLFSRRALVAAGVAAAVIVLPFVAWGPADFAHDVFGNLAQAPAPDRLTIWALMASMGIQLPRAVLLILSALALGTTAWAAHAMRHEPARALVACGLCLGLFALCSSFAAYNYYAYGLVFVTWGLLLPARLDLRSERASQDPPSPAPAAAAAGW